MKRWWAAGLLALLLGLLISGGRGSRETPITDFMAALERGEIDTAVLTRQGNSVLLTGRSEKGPYRTRTLVDDPAVSLAALEAAGAEVAYQPPARLTGLGLLSGLLTLVLIGALIYALFRLRAPGQEPAQTFGKTGAALVSESSVSARFSDVAGCDEAKADLAEVVDFLRHPQRYHRLGARIPHGLLLVGPPGSGKTLLARAVAGEAGVAFFSVSGSDFVEMFVGVGAARVRDLFTQARKNAPCIIFIDEIDAVGRKRGFGFQGNDEREQTLNGLLVEMDGFSEQGTGQEIVVLAATNRPDVLDAALLRPGRFDRQVVVDAPDVRGRETILRLHARKKPLDPSVDLALVARRTAGMVGADLENLLNEAALGAARAGRERIEPGDLDEARDRVLMGPERRSLVVQLADRRVTAYHEVGHALAAQLLPHAHKAHKLTVVPRGRSLGSALYTPEDRMHMTRSALLDQLCVILAGHAAEEVALGEVTTGAQSDFQQATNLARRMVMEWGMSEAGPLAYGQDAGGYLGSAVQAGPHSNQTAEALDRAVINLIDEQYRRATELLRGHQHVLQQLTELLLERESLSGDELQAVLAGEVLPGDVGAQPWVTSARSKTQ
ncbi:ATP-dependent zinc metalloprotease FtsH [Deinococcus lacus]|uniref:ATP-dependent zinc metalloprotease FtsH n=1 Tax=Deinococcus lacus TaxID=392561 RepID=A0ABW1YF01_9DEIO